MENPLLCNSLKCRKELTDRALVTTCSHIFCLDCVQRSGLVGQENQRCTVCPVCNAQLAREEDVAFINLSPTEEFKTCVLSGLSPNIVMECAGRAISFWVYQATHNLYYQQYLYKSLKEKQAMLWSQFDQVNRDSKAEIHGLYEKLKSVTDSRDVLQRQNDELARAYQEKSRKLFQMQELYNKVKKWTELGQLERAAGDAVDSSTRSIPQPAVNSQASNIFRLHHFQDDNERSFPLSRGPRFDANEFTTAPPGSNLQQYENESRWPRKRPQFHDHASEARPFRQTPSGRLSADIFRPNIVSNIELTGGDGMRRSGASSPSFAQRPNGWAGVGLTSGLKVGQPVGHSGLNGSLKGL